MLNGLMLLGSSRGTRWIKASMIVGVFLLFIAYGLLVLTKPISQDEGVFLTIGKYMNQGWAPYRDLVDHKPPGLYFLFAGLFAIFGTSVWVIKGALILSTLAAAGLLKHIGDHLKPGVGWWAAALWLFLMTQFEGYYLIAEPFMLLPLLLALWLLLRRPEAAGWMWLAGALAATVVLYKQSAVLSLIPLIIIAIRTKRKRFFAAGLLTPWLMTALYLKANGLFADAWHQIVGLTLANYPSEPIGTVLRAWRWNFGWTLPVWIMLILGARTLMPHRRLLWALILLPLPLMFFRHYAHYWVQVLPFVALIVAVGLMTVRARQVQLATLVFCLAIAGGKIIQEAGPNYHLLQTQFEAATYLNENPAMKILAENKFTAFYFLLDQRPLNRFLYLTEVTGALGAEQETITHLSRETDILLLWPNPSHAYARRLETVVRTEWEPNTAWPNLEMESLTLRPGLKAKRLESR